MSSWITCLSCPIYTAPWWCNSHTAVSNKGRVGTPRLEPNGLEIAFGYLLIRLIFMHTCAHARAVR